MGTMLPKVIVFFALVFESHQDLIKGLNDVVDFAQKYYDEINFDGLLGFVIAEGQLLQAKNFDMAKEISAELDFIIAKCRSIRNKVLSVIPLNSTKMSIFGNYLVHPKKWMGSSRFTYGKLDDLGIYEDWNKSTILDDKKAVYKNVPSDVCVLEILQENCFVSDFCQEMMLAPRIDVGYLLSHRLFYLQIARLKRCHVDRKMFKYYTNRLCSLMLKEARTNEFLGFPTRDIVLEQMVLCGIEGYAEFLNEDWRNKVSEWQNPSGCYIKKEDEKNVKRSINTIAFGCQDHTTGLGAAALALNLRYVLYEITNHLCKSVYLVSEILV